MNFFAFNALYVLWALVQESLSLPVPAPQDSAVKGKVSIRSIDASSAGLGGVSEQSLNQLVRAAEKVAEEIKHTDEELDAWEAPADMTKNYPYYLSGYDEEDRPIWVAEVGRWDLRKIVESGPDTVNTFSKYIAQASRRILKSLEDKSSSQDPNTEVIFIADFDGFPVSQISHGPTMAYLIQMTRLYRSLILDHIHTGLVINANYVAETVINLVKPLLGEIMDKIEVFGTNKSRWIPELLKRLPEDQIPAWYGGSKDYKPVNIFG